MNSIPNSLNMQKRAAARILGMTQLLSKRPDRFSRGVWPTYFSKAKGIRVWDLDGYCYKDMSIGGIGANVLGYADADVDAAVKHAIDVGNSSSLNCPEDIELADLLCEIHPWASRVRYARTGGESMAIAVRIARAYTRRDTVAFCGYHGWHDWYLSANIGTENALGEHLLSGLNPAGVPKGLNGTALPFRYNQLDELRSIVSENKSDLAAIIMEPIRGELPEPGFLEGVRQLANEAGAALIVDEISAGFRLNSGGAHLKLGLEPDIAVFSKAIGNGYPIGAIIGRDSVMQAAQDTFISSTYWTERIGPTAGLATIQKHRRLNVGDHLVNIGAMVQDGWTECAAKHDLNVHVGGIAPLSHFTFDNAKNNSMKALFIQIMLDAGFLASTSFYSMYAHTTDDVSSYLSSVDKAFQEIKMSLTDNCLEEKLRGSPPVDGFSRLA